MRIGTIDQGTTSTRLLVVDEAGMRISGSLSHQTSYPHPGWVEQDPFEILANMRRLVAEAGHLDALGLANQGESCLAWDGATGEPLTAIIVWQDNRTAAELAALALADAARITALSSLPPDPYFSASKLGWIIRNVPAARTARDRGTLRLGTTDAFIFDRLGGRFVTDRATASRTSLMNMRTGLWDAGLCTLFGVPIECLPEIVPNVADFGRHGGIPIRAAIVDQQAALYGHGCRAPGDAKITFGTGAFALAVTDGPVPPETAAGLLPTVAWDLGTGARYAIDGGLYDAGTAIDWAIRAGLADGIADFQHFDAPPAFERGIVFIPAFSGLAAPLWDRTAVPIITGLTPQSTRRDICQALLEGIALSAALLVDAMSKVVPLTGALSIDGGVSRSPYFAQFLADSLGRPVTVRGFSERTALGVAAIVADSLGVPLPSPLEPDTIWQPAPVPSRLERFRALQQRSIGLRPG